MSDRIVVMTGRSGPAFGDGEGTGAQGEPATPDERGHRTPLAVASFDPDGCGSADLGNGADREFSAPAPEGVSLSSLIRDRQEAFQHGLLLEAREHIAALQAEVERLTGLNVKQAALVKTLRVQVAWWQAAASEATDERGVVVRCDAIAGELA